MEPFVASFWIRSEFFRTRLEFLQDRQVPVALLCRFLHFQLVITC